MSGFSLCWSCASGCGSQPDLRPGRWGRVALHPGAQGRPAWAAVLQPEPLPGRVLREGMQRPRARPSCSEWSPPACTAPGAGPRPETTVRPSAPASLPWTWPGRAGRCLRPLDALALAPPAPQGKMSREADDPTWRCRVHAASRSTAVCGPVSRPGLAPRPPGRRLQGSGWNKKGSSRNPEVVAHYFTRDPLEAGGGWWGLRTPGW